MAEASIIAFQLAEIVTAVVVVTVMTCTLVCGVLIAKRFIKNR